MEEQRVKGFAHVLLIVLLFELELCISSKMKRGPSKASEGGPAQKRAVSYETIKNWRMDLDRDYQTVSWLDCDTVSEGGKKAVKRLKCSVCSKFKASIRGRRNFSERWIIGAADSVRKRNVKDHAQPDQHAHAMLLRKEQGRAAGLRVASYALLHRHCPSYLQKRKASLGRCLTYVVYFVTTEKLPFTKYPGICELEARHGVDIVI